MRVARGVANHALNLTSTDSNVIHLAGVDMVRDWGHARDYVRGIWMILQQDSPRDMVLATGRQWSVRDFAEAAFAHVGVTLRYVLLNFLLYVACCYNWICPPYFALLASASWEHLIQPGRRLKAANACGLGNPLQLDLRTRYEDYERCKREDREKGIAD